MSKLKRYTITLLKVDGTESLHSESSRKPSYEEIKSALNADSIELVGAAYYAGKGWGRCEVYADGEGRYKENSDNLHFTMFPNGRFMPPIVGECVRIKREAANV